MAIDIYPIQMHVFWANVTKRIEQALNRESGSLDPKYVAEVCRNTKHNSEISGIKDHCIYTELMALKRRGIKPVDDVVHYINDSKLVSKLSLQ